VAHSLTNLEPVAGRRVQVFCLPVNFRGADGAPVRVVAQVD
jgi:kynurenine formamidase